MAAGNDSYLTPPTLGKRWGVAPEKVIELIRSGELRAINLATNANGIRPRWHIPLAAVEAFEQARSNQPKPEAPKRRRRAATTSGKQWF